MQGAVFVCHRLMTGGNVNNAQSPVTETNLTINEHSDIVRPAMRDYVAHARECIRIDSPSRPTGEGYAIDTAHKTPTTLEPRFLT
jgi:hypothetical protein